MRIVPILAILISCASCGGRPAAVDGASCTNPPRAEQPLSCFQDCVRDEDCVPVSPNQPCACTPWVVNRAFEEIALEKARIEADRVAHRDGGSGPGCGCWSCLGEPACLEGRCALRYSCVRSTPDGLQ